MITTIKLINKSITFYSFVYERMVKIYAFCKFQVQIRSDQSLSRVRLFATPWITAHQASLSITNSQSSLRVRSIESVMPSSHVIKYGHHVH